MRIVEEVCAVDGLLEAMDSPNADLLLTDLALSKKYKDTSNLSFFRQLESKEYHLPLLVIIQEQHAEFVSHLLEIGCNGLLSLDASPEVLKQAIRTISKGDLFVEESLQNSLWTSLTQQKQHPSCELSSREYEVLVRISQGESVQIIAESLSLSPKTISTYRTRVLKKLGLATTSDLVRYAIKHGLVGLGSRIQ